MTTFPVWIPEAIRYDKDTVTGAEIEQLTSDAVISTNIYCEQRYASADGMRIAMERRPFGRPTELWVCDLRSLRICRIAEGTPVGANSPSNAIYYITSQNDGASLMRLDLESLSSNKVFHFNDTPPSCGAVSPDERWFVNGPFPVKDNVYSLRCIDLVNGQNKTLCEIEDMFNPHIQFDPADGRLVIVQINRSGQMKRHTGGKSITVNLGAKLCVVDIVSREIISLPAGRPETPPISGHECWAGKTGRILFTAGQYNVSSSAYVTLKEPPDEEREMPAAAIYSVAPGETTARVVAQGLLFNHMAGSDDGKFFIADDHTTGRIYVGSVATGCYLPLCESQARQGTCQHSHIHAYMTPDNRHVIFNSTVTGVSQVYAARIPDGFLEKVLKQ